MTLAATTCPPHHWLVEEQLSGLQHWVCYRCGAEREQQQAVPTDRPTVPWASQRARAKLDPLE
jgi:hypothetical protein